jgi:type VI protein secretion system component Hcp
MTKEKGKENASLLALMKAIGKATPNLFKSCTFSS